VEARGIEPLSENLFPQLSTGVVYLLKFLLQTADKQAVCKSSSDTFLRCEQAAGTFTTDRCPTVSRGTLAEDTYGLSRRLFKTAELKQPELLRSCCRKQKYCF